MALILNSVGRTGLVFGTIILLVQFPAAAISSGHCSDPGYCDGFTPLQIGIRMLVGYAPGWMLVLVVLGLRSRRWLVVVAAAGSLLALVTWLLATAPLESFRSSGLSSVPGFALYWLPAAGISVSALLALAPVPAEPGSRYRPFS